MATLRVPEYFQGQTGTGQGGFTAHRFTTAIGGALTVAFRSPIPLDTDLQVVAEADAWRLVDPAAPDVTILEATRWDEQFSTTTPVSVSDAEDARKLFPLDAKTHPAPKCWSCGLDEGSMRVHSGPLDDGRWATPWRAPSWALDEDGSVDEASLWASIDCASGWYVSCSAETIRHSVTVQYAVEVLEPLQPDTDYALVSWSGDYAPSWDGRKRGAAAEVFDSAGRSIARARSFWLSV